MECMVTVKNGPIPQEEINAYIERAREKFHKEPKHIYIDVQGDEVELRYDFGDNSFHRLRRITGYLVGDMRRWNNAKRAEENDRVKHAV